MKHLLLALLILTFAGCVESTLERRKTKEKYSGRTVEIVVFEGCEYVHFGMGDWSWGAHKGDCRNSIHNKQEVKDEK
jgi:hypothetical protein